MGKKQPNDRLLENFVATNKKLPRIGHRYRIPPQSFFLPLFLPRTKEEQLFIRVDGDLFFLKFRWGHLAYGRGAFSVWEKEISVASMLRKLAWDPLATVTRGSDMACCSFFFCTSVVSEMKLPDEYTVYPKRKRTKKYN